MVEYEGIKLGDRFNCYDDGKVRVSRQNIITIKEIIPKEEWSADQWYEINEWTQDTDWMSKVDHEVCIIGVNSEGEEYIFLKNQDDYWFSVDNWGPGLLDVTGNLTENLINSLIKGDFDYGKEQVEYFIKQLTNREICEDINETKLIIKTLKGCKYN